MSHADDDLLRRTPAEGFEVCNLPDIPDLRVVPGRCFPVPPLVVPFQPGELVRLKSGGPWMTVQAVHMQEGTADCAWFDPEEGFYSFPFVLAGLVQTPE
jgi:uncharacterized protein YodC (DUF2158 family)